MRSALDCGGKRSATPLWNRAFANEKRRRRCVLPAQSRIWRVIASAALLLSLSLHAAEFSLNSFTVESGGGKSTGGGYELSGSIGQADAGSTMSAGDYRVDGSFLTLIAAVQTQGAPLLTISVTTTNTVIVSWPSSSTGFVLQENSDSASANWSDSKLTSSDSGTRKSVLVPTSVGNKYFRLRKP